MKVHRTRLEVLNILDHLDLHGERATSAKYGVDSRTLKRWAAREPSGWQREEEINRLLMVTKRLDGKVNYRDAVVGLGIATDKLWRMADRAARTLRREEHEAEPAAELWVRRARIFDEEAPSYWQMPAHRSSNPADRDAPEYLAAMRLHEYTRACRRALVDRLDEETHPDDPRDPIIPDAIGEAGVYYLLRHGGDTQPGGGPSSADAWDAPGIGLVSTPAMDDEQYRAHVRTVLALAQAEADRWWPLHEAAIEEYRAKADAPALAPEPIQPSASVNEPTRLPTARISRPTPVPMVLDVGGGERDGPWYDIETGQRRSYP